MNTDVIPADSVAGVNALDLLGLIKEVGQEDLKSMISQFGGEVLHFFANVILALAVYYVGRWVLHRIIKIIDIAFDKRNVELSIRSFARSMITGLGYVFIILIIVQILGVNTTSLVAMLASAGLAIGMALSGTLQNFAGGVMILFLKPYKVGDYITSQGESGVVKEIKLFTTVLETPDRHTIFVPNSSISSSVIDNASFADTRRVDWSVGISYGDSVAQAREVILELLSEEKRIIKSKRADQQPMVGVTALADSSVNLTVRAWVKTADYWGVYFDMYEKLYDTLPQRGVNFPFPQMDIHIKDKQ